MDVFCGLDLGRYTDFCALSLMTRELAVDAVSGLPMRDHRGNAQYFWQIRALRRWPLRTPYTEVVRQVVKNVTRSDVNPPPRVVVDHSGVGTAVLDQVRQALLPYEDIEVWGISITAGDTWKFSGRQTLNVSKTQITSSLAEALGNERVLICPRADGSKMENQEILERELAAFKIRVSKTGYQSVEATGSDHDDCVISVALPLWLGTQTFMHMRTIGSANIADIYLGFRERTALVNEQAKIEREEATALRREQEREAAEKRRQENPLAMDDLSEEDKRIEWAPRGQTVPFRPCRNACGTPLLVSSKPVRDQWLYWCQKCGLKTAGDSPRWVETGRGHEEQLFDIAGRIQEEHRKWRHFMTAPIDDPSFRQLGDVQW